MVLGILGKGGSGKSTISTLLTQYLLSTGSKVLAVDADHNMDLAYNLGYTGNDGPYIGGSFLSLRNEFGLDDSIPTEQIFTQHIPSRRFTLTPPDTYTEAHSRLLAPNLRLMMSGPQHDQVLYGQHCSHSLAAPLKIFLPLLTLQPDESVVVDEKASVDAVSTGIPTGFDLAVVVAEPRPHSLRVASDIMNLLTWYEVPFCFVLNKVQDPETSLILAREFITHTPIAIFSLATEPLDAPVHQSALEAIVTHAHTLKGGQQNRLSRTINKYKRNEHFSSVPTV